MQSTQAFGEGLKQNIRRYSIHYNPFSFIKSGLFTGKILRKKASTLSELIDNNGVLDISVSYKFISSPTLLDIHKILDLYFMGDFYRSV